MDSAFQHLASIPTSLHAEDRAKKDLEANVRRAKHASAGAITPMVIRVLDDFRDNALKQMQTHTQATEKDSYYFWGIGFPAEVQGYKFFWTAVDVRPVFSDSGAIESLATSLHVPNFKKHKALGRQFGLAFEPERDGDKGGGATATATIRHPATQEGLTQALLALFPPEYLKVLLVELRDQWRVS